MTQQTEKRSDMRGHHSDKSVIEMIIDLASAFSGSRVSLRTAITWAALTGGIIIAGGTIAILVAVK